MLKVLVKFIFLSEGLPLSPKQIHYCIFMLFFFVFLLFPWNLFYCFFILVSPIPLTLVVHVLRRMASMGVWKGLNSGCEYARVLWSFNCGLREWEKGVSFKDDVFVTSLWKLFLTACFLALMWIIYLFIALLLWLPLPHRLVFLFVTFIWLFSIILKLEYLRMDGWLCLFRWLCAFSLFRTCLLGS